MIHEFITCDLCNEDGEIDTDLIGGFDDGARFQVSSADVDHVRSLGWEVNEGDPHKEHVCPACQHLQPGDDGYEEWLAKQEDPSAENGP